MDAGVLNQAEEAVAKVGGSKGRELLRTDCRAAHMCDCFFGQGRAWL